MFVDKVKIRIRAGDGGNGAVSFHREKYRRCGRTRTAGTAGAAATSCSRRTPTCHTLVDFKYKQPLLRGERASPGGGGRRSGRNGAAISSSRVPRGTVVRDAETGRVMADLSRR